MLDLNWGTHNLQSLLWYANSCCSMWDLDSLSGIELGPSALGIRSLSRWTTREVPGLIITVGRKSLDERQDDH